MLEPIIATTNTQALPILGMCRVPMAPPFRPGVENLVRF
jgi:hypothetical protein